MATRLQSFADDHVTPMAGVAVAVVAVSTSAVLIEASSAPAVVGAFYRVLFTTLLLAPFARRYRDDFARLSRRDGAAAAVTGLALAAHFAAWFASIDYTSVAAAATLVQGQVVFVALGSWLLLGEALGVRNAAGIGVAVAGAVVMSFGGLDLSDLTATTHLYGDALAVLGALFSAGYVMAGRSLRQRVALVPYVLVVYAVCAAALLAAVLAFGHPVTGYPPAEYALFLGMAVGPGVLGHTVINWALKYVPSSVVSVSLLGEPVGSTLLALAVFGQVPGPYTVTGGVLVLAGIAVVVRARA